MIRLHRLFAVLSYVLSLGAVIAILRDAPAVAVVQLILGAIIAAYGLMQGPTKP
jgi:hypothetical protein